MTEPSAPIALDAMGIREFLPHRYPFLLVDKVIEIVPEKSIKARKCVSQNEPFFQGHFPDYAVMPGVLQIEALAQAGALLLLTLPEYKGGLVFLTGVDGFKFRRPVVPGDVLDLDVELLRFRRGFGRVRAVASVNGEVAAEGEIGFAGRKKADADESPEV
jgi:3-hydroxyacyl-[acyl-carrier-protein] dehydratase